MDLHLIPGAVATPAERAAIDDAITAHPAPGISHPAPGTSHPAPGTSHAAPGTRHQAPRHALLPALHAVQARIGWISEGALNDICERLSVPPAEAYGVAAFYAMFSLAPRPPLVVHVCDDLACRVNGAEDLCAELERQIGTPGTPTRDGSATWHRSPCLGQCERAPAALFQRAGEMAADWTLTHATANAIVAGVDVDGAQAVGPVAPPLRAIYARPARLLRRAGIVNPESLDDYRAHGGYAALRRAFALGPEHVIREVLDSRLVGRGGAAFPTGRKWDAVARAPVGPHYLVCNADESEPGTFKDRVLMEEDPFALVEAMTIAGFATGCETGFVYISGEYPLATRRLTGAVEQARRRGLLGDDVFGEGVRFDIALRRGAGAYICGEETALFNSIEGFRGEPRNKPPFPVQAGLFGKPTVVNNVETLVNVLDIVLEGGQAFAGLGAAGSTGTKLFCVSGCAERPGVYEVAFGTTLGQLIDLAGGVRGGRPLQAVLLGGAAGVFATPDEIDMPLTLEGTRAAGATLGSGAVLLFDDRVDLGDIVLRIARFFRDESCGQCVPCRIGTVRQEEALHRLARGDGQVQAAAPAASAEAESARPKRARVGVGPHEHKNDDLTLINDVAQVMRDASICGLGQTASSAVQTAIQKLGVFEGSDGGQKGI